MERVTTKDLYFQLRDRLIIELAEHEILCSKCKGLRFVLVEENKTAYIEPCNQCYTGKLTVCKHCGKGNKSLCDCAEARDERDNEYRMKQAQRDFKAYQKAEKIHYKDYKGYFILDNDDHIKDMDDVSEWIYDKLVDGEDVPEYLWAVEKSLHFSIDLKDVISNKCEDGYEDMYSHLDTNSLLLSQAQELINKWEKEQGISLYIFNETYKKAVIIKDLVEEIREEISNA